MSRINIIQIISFFIYLLYQALILQHAKATTGDDPNPRWIGM